MVAVFYDKRESCIGKSEKEWKISTLFLLQTYVRSDNIRKKERVFGVVKGKLICIFQKI